MYILSDLRQVVRDMGRFLLFRPIRPDLERLAPLYFFVGFLFTWLAGIGRHLDNPRLDWWQHLGLDSIAYVFVFSTFLWLLLWPLRPANWRFSSVLLFVMMTAPPALLYVLPLCLTSTMALLRLGGGYLEYELISRLKLGLLVIVATWRVALLVGFLNRVAQLGSGTIFVATALPLALIVGALAVLNLDRATFDIMAGRDPPTSDDGAYAILILIHLVSILAVPFLLIAYLWRCYWAWYPPSRRGKGAR